LSGQPLQQTLNHPFNPLAGLDPNLGALNPIGNALDSAFSSTFGAPPPPTLKSPDALSSQPTMATATTTAIQNQLAEEKTARLTSSYINGGAGLFGSSPITTSAILGGR
jgi:hypothetical protein